MATELEAAKKEYPNSTPAGKKLLEKIFGKPAFLPSVQEQVNSFEAAYPIFKKIKTKDPLWLLLQNRKVAELSVVEKLMIVTEAIRHILNWSADYTNSDQKKWFPVHIQKGSGFVFSDTFCAFTYTHTDCGSRFALPTDELARHFGSHKNFMPLWNELLIIKK